MKRTIGIIILLLLVAGVVIQLRSGYRKINKAGTLSGKSNIVYVTVAPVEENETNILLHLTGTLYPVKELDLAAQAQGQITFLDAEPGAYKTEGSTIAIIDNDLRQLAVHSAEINDAKLKRDLERSQNLYNGGTLTRQQFEDAKDAYDYAKIQLDQARKQLADATVIAPFHGVITEKYVEQGAYINPGNPIISLENLSILKIKINVSEATIYKLKTGNEATVSTEIYPGQEFQAKVTYVGSAGDASHNYPLELEFANSDQYPLKAGTFVNVSLDLPGQSRALSIPREALVGSTQNASVYVAENGKAILRKITVQSNAGDDLQVISGLNKGEQVIVSGQINLTDGMGIIITEN
jgi:membrane fusion protein, multidrug efflux system